MPTPYDDYLVSDSAGAPTVSPIVQQSGIGLGSNDAAADRQEFVDSRSTIGRIALPFQEMRAARQGRKSEFQQMQEEKQKGRQRQLEEIRVFSDVVNHTFEKAEGMQGEARDKYIGLQGKVLDALSPGSSEFLKSLAADPEYAAILRKNADKSPTLKTALEVGGLKKAMELFKSVEGAKLIRGEIEGAEFPAIRTRLQTLGMAAQELMTPERYKQMMDDGFISPVEAAELNESAKAHPKYKAAALSEEQLSLAARNEDATYGMAGFATSKTAQEALKDKGKPASDLGKLKKDLKDGKINQAEYDAKYKKLTHIDSDKLKLPDDVKNKVAGIQLKILSGETPTTEERTFLDEVARTNPLVAAMRDALGGAPGEPAAPSNRAAGKVKPPAAKPLKGAVIARGGKKYKVVGFDKDGEPLVEPAK